MSSIQILNHMSLLQMHLKHVLQKIYVASCHQDPISMPKYLDQDVIPGGNFAER
jgi:hypothetical protein